jgi:hypothetical protein
LECLINDLDQANEDGAGRRERSEQELHALEIRLAEVQIELDTIGTDYESRLAQERDLRQESVYP